MAKRRIVSALMSALFVLLGTITANPVVQASQAVQATRESFKVRVNYDLPLADMIAAGKYSFEDSDINSRNFPIKGNGQIDVSIELIHFSGDTESSGVLRKLDVRGLRPATLPELLAFGATYPAKQYEFPIVAMGSVWHGMVPVWWRNRDGKFVPMPGRSYPDRLVAFLDVINGRGLYLRPLDCEPGHECRWGDTMYRRPRFAAVRK